LRRNSLLLILGIVLLLLGTACSSNNASANALRLRTETARWNRFSMEGIAQASYQGLSLRKYFIVRKDVATLRLDVIDGGFAGMSGQPLLSFYKGDYVALKCPMMPQLEFLDIDKYFPHQAFDTFVRLDSLVAVHADEILRDKTMFIDSIRVDFDPAYRIKQVFDPAIGAKLTFSYTSRGEPDKLEITPDKDTSLLLLIDKFETGPQEITPLERSVNTQDLFKDLSDKMEKLLQNFPEKPND